MKLDCGKITFRNVERKRTPVRSPYACVTTTTYVYPCAGGGGRRGCVQVVEGGEGMCAGGGGRRGDVCRWWREERGCVQVVEGGEGV